MSMDSLQDSSMMEKLSKIRIDRVSIIVLLIVISVFGFVAYIGDDSQAVTGDEAFDVKYTESGVLITQTSGDPVGEVDVSLEYVNNSQELRDLNIESIGNKEIVTLDTETYHLESLEILWYEGDNKVVLHEENLPEDQIPEEPTISLQEVDVRVGETRALNAQDYINSETEIDEYNWKLQNKSSSQKQSYVLQYNKEGTYEGQISIVDSIGNMITENFTVYVESPKLLGEVDLTTRVETGNVVEFNATDYTSSEVSSYSWNIDGNKYSSPVAEHVFRTEGSKQVELTVTDSFGYSETYSQEIIALEPLKISINAQEKSGLGIFTVQADSDATSYKWNFGDGSVKTTSVPTATHQYDSEGEYFVTVSVTTDKGRTEVENTNFLVGSADNNTSSGNSSKGETVEVEFDTAKNNYWSVVSVDGTKTDNVLPNDGIGDYNPDLRLNEGTKYVFKGLDSKHPFELSDMFGDPVLSQEFTTTFEDSESISWNDKGSEVSLTFTEELSEWVDSYQSASDRENMNGDILKAT